MPYYFRFFWDGENELHIAEHGITRAEFVDVVLAAMHAEVMDSHSSDRLIVIGETCAGRKIACVFDEINESECYPVTAFDVK